ncbi:DUF1456 family protein [uncultured Ilyobacter sp.]|uniref:DUF1456 family protein n=1 Tax=uncultured Ilyobacter sp. TaxID=544433 RepID=UPI0029F57816|nr:DUF1456 family protein [uncultured Ilyobacter sp.]
MSNNDIMRAFRYALDIKDSQMIEAFGISGYELTLEDLKNFLKKDDEEGQVKCNDRIMTLFLDGFITLKRGKKEPKEGEVKKPEKKLTNNMILKKMQIALNLRSDDMLKVFKAAGLELSNSELSALFRNKDHKNYMECGDKFMRNFLKGLTISYRG